MARLGQKLAEEQLFGEAGFLRAGEQEFLGRLDLFEREFDDDLAVIAHAIKQYGLPANLKLSVHSGSDKFSIYAPILRAI